MERKFQVALAALILSLARVSYAGVPQNSESLRTKDVSLAACAARFKTSSFSIDGFLFSTFRNDLSGKSCLRVVENGRIVFDRTGDNDDIFTIGQTADQENGIEAVPDGVDLTGLGHPNVLVSQWTGGAHCCRVHYVFELRPKFRLVAKLESHDDDLAHFVHGVDGRWSFDTADWSFAYWYGSFAGSPSHEVVLKFEHGAYHLDWEAMRRPAPNATGWVSMLAAIRKEVDAKQRGNVAELRSTLWQNVLDLIYTGHTSLAWKLIEQAGPSAQDDSYPTLADFCSTLKESPYWEDLKPTMRDAPVACLRGK